MLVLAIEFGTIRYLTTYFRLKFEIASLIKQALFFAQLALEQTFERHPRCHWPEG